jgi:hypothetical protein
MVYALYQTYTGANDSGVRRVGEPLRSECDFNGVLENHTAIYPLSIRRIKTGRNGYSQNGEVAIARMAKWL